MGNSFYILNKYKRNQKKIKNNYVKFKRKIMLLCLENNDK